MAETFADYLDRIGHHPTIDLDTADQQRHIVIVSFAGGVKKAIVELAGVAAGDRNEYLSADIYAFVDGQVARSSVMGLEDGSIYPAFRQNAPGRSHGRPAVRAVTVFIGAQQNTEPLTRPADSLPDGPGPAESPNSSAQASSHLSSPDAPRNHMTDGNSHPDFRQLAQQYAHRYAQLIIDALGGHVGADAAAVLHRVGFELGHDACQVIAREIQARTTVGTDADPALLLDLIGPAAAELRTAASTVADRQPPRSEIVDARTAEQLSLQELLDRARQAMRAEIDADSPTGRAFAALIARLHREGLVR
ncbi:hypothetical protein Q0Z83_110750 [Actinoplanes sichuanensis]|uniref:Uncharacterized protein n=1 Tax=Actinoplanes sichuanensis TaxID=512349 RepID=A0ABW4A1X2_9ACTN|nr:hypothetical protein [Actinoplanes sichuanensis]BEL12884.1 hypothetical protein Q0Z83_110750 [Actinoplanes sichuanensis]